MYVIIVPEEAIHVEMSYLTQHIGKVLRNVRRERNLTLDDLSKLTGVSKPMLGQIERGESNPTVVTLWKIASGLEVPFSYFLQDVGQPRATVVRQQDQAVVRDDGGNYVVRNVLAVRNPQPADLYESLLLPGCSHSADSHGINVTEGIWIKHGQLTLMLEKEEYVMKEGDSIHFQASIHHTYINHGTLSCEFLVMLVYLPSDDPKLS